VACKPDKAEEKEGPTGIIAANRKKMIFSFSGTIKSISIGHVYQMADTINFCRLQKLSCTPDAWTMCDQVCISVKKLPGSLD